MDDLAKNDIGVSVIIPCYNAGAFIDESVESVLNQNTNVPYEIIIVDDGSNDTKTLERVSYYENCGNDQITVIRHDKNKGLPSTRNTAIEAAKYPFILPLDADDRLVTPDKLEGRYGFIDQGAQKLSKDSNLDVVTPQAYMFGNVEGNMRYPRFDERRILFKNHIPAFSMIRKSTLDEVGGYNPDMRFAEDWDLWVSIADNHLKKGKTGGFHRIDEHLVELRTHADGSSLSASFKSVSTWPFKEMLKRSPKVFEHHFPNVPKIVMPSYLLGLKLGYLGKLSLKSVWSDNANTFMACKKGQAKALIRNFLPSRNKIAPDEKEVSSHEL